MKAPSLEYTLNAPDAKTTEAFVDEFSLDTNPYHRQEAGHRQLIPGDWMVAQHLSSYGLPLHHQQDFYFTGSLKPNEEFHMSPSGLYRNEKPLMQVNPDANRQSLGDYQPSSELISVISNHQDIMQGIQSHTDTESPLLRAVMGEYALCSQDMQEFFSEEELNKRGLEKTPKTLAMYVSGSIITTPGLLTRPHDTFRMLEKEPSISIEDRKGKYAKATIDFHFPLFQPVVDEEDAEQHYELQEHLPYRPIGLIEKRVQAINLIRQ